MERVDQLIRELGIVADVMEVAVPDAASAAAVRFLGSPTIHVNGIDVEPAARNAKLFGLACRFYSSGPVRQGVPPLRLIREALFEQLSIEALDSPPVAF